MGILEDFRKRKRTRMQRVAAPYGWVWDDSEGPPEPDEEQLAKMTGKKNIAEWLREQAAEGLLVIAHGTTNELWREFKEEGLKANPEWGGGRNGIFAWTDEESAINWANFWYGWDAMVLLIRPTAVTEAYFDKDQGNRQWQWSEHSKSIIIKNDIPPEGIYHKFEYSDDEDSEWQQQRDYMKDEEEYSGLFDWRQRTRWHGHEFDEGDIGWAKQVDYMDDEELDEIEAYKERQQRELEQA